MTDTEPDSPETETDDAAEGAVGGQWVRRAPTGPPHRCRMPTTYSQALRAYVAAANDGDVWRCGCGRLWVCYIRVPNQHYRGGMAEAGGTRTPTWRPAALWQHLRYAPLWRSVPPGTWAGLAAGLAVLALIAILSLLGVTPPP